MRVAFGGCADALDESNLQAFEASLDDREIGEDQLGVEDFEIALRVNCLFDVRDGVVFKRADDVEERIALDELVEQIAIHPALFADAALEPGDVVVLHLRARRLARVEHFGKHIHARIRYVNHCGMDFQFAGGVRRRFDLSARERVEDGSFGAVG